MWRKRPSCITLLVARLIHAARRWRPFSAGRSKRDRTCEGRPAVTSPEHCRNIGAVDADVVQLRIAHGGKLVVSPPQPARHGDAFRESIEGAIDCAPGPTKHLRRLTIRSAGRVGAARRHTGIRRESAAHKRYSIPPAPLTIKMYVIYIFLRRSSIPS